MRRLILGALGAALMAAAPAAAEDVHIITLPPAAPTSAPIGSYPHAAADSGAIPEPPVWAFAILGLGIVAGAGLIRP
jgi:hypothetical protein